MSMQMYFMHNFAVYYAQESYMYRTQSTLGKLLEHKYYLTCVCTCIKQTFHLLTSVSVLYIYVR